MDEHSNTESRALLTEGVAALGLDLPSAVLEHLLIYLQELKLWNARINLTGLKTDRDMIIKHFLDSLAVLAHLGEPASLMDLGSGAGFPGLVVKLARPELALTLVEARQKKAGFLEYLAGRLRLTEVKVVQAHLTPTLARRWEPKASAVVSRATFALPRLLELAAPLLKANGLLLALKSIHLPETELADAGRAGARLGLAPMEQRRYCLPISGEPRLLVMTRKP
jgi:16S rRNA (guanine527-N7)-methyltransferase